MKKLISYFIRGLLIFVPITLTIVVLVLVVTKLDLAVNQIFDSKIPGGGLLLLIAIIFAIGFIASNFLGKKLFAFIDGIFTRMPLVKLLYSAVKDILEAFAGDKKSFDKPVLVRISPGADARIIGFVTRDSLENFGLQDYVAVYMPQSYNFAGNVLLFPKDSVEPLNVESSQAMAFIVSGGLSGGSV